MEPVESPTGPDLVLAGIDTDARIEGIGGRGKGRGVDIEGQVGRGDGPGGLRRSVVGLVERVRTIPGGTEPEPGWGDTHGGWEPRPGLGARLAPVLTTVGTVALVLAMFWLWQSADAVDQSVDERLPFLASDMAGESADGSEAADRAAAASVRGDPAGQHGRSDGRGPAGFPDRAQPGNDAQAPGGNDPADPAGRPGTQPTGTTDPATGPADPTPPIVPEAIIVHVSGAVVAPGVVEVAEPARVFNAIEAAGGSRPEAELDRLNLAAPIVDGERIHVPAVGETSAPELVSTQRPAAAPAGETQDAPSLPTAVARLDINMASATELQALRGIGPTIAGAIVDLRTARGPYRSVDELLDVDGIGPAKLEEIRDLVLVADPRRG